MIREIAGDFYRIILPMPFRLSHVNVYALVQDSRVTLFDAGLNTPEAFTTLEAGLKRIGRSLREIDRIFITHRHGDHCGMAGRLREISGAKILMTDTDHASIRMGDDMDRMIMEIQSFYRFHGLEEDVVASFAAIFKGWVKMTGSFSLDHPLRNGETFDIGKHRLEVLAAPGHSRGQVCFFFRTEGILLAGDHILPEITPNLSPDLLEPDFRPLERYLSSLTDMEQLPVQIVYPAHGRPFTNFKERIAEIREHHQERRGLTLASVRENGKSACEISVDLFGENLPEFDRFLALNETYVHLVELVRGGLIQTDIRDKRCFYRRVD